MSGRPSIEDLAPDPPSGSDPAYLASVGNRVRLTRARRGMTRRLLAEHSGVSERYIAQLEAGQGNVSLLVLRGIARGLGVDPVALLSDAPEAPPLDMVLAQLSEAQLADARGLLERHFGAAGQATRRQRVALVGLRGAGKSTLGRMLADARGVAFHELDREIERDAGMALSEMFELHGQAGYRRFERGALERLLAEPGGAVIAAGGGIVAEGATYALLLARCFTVWLRASPEEHMRRVVHQGDLRPMRDNRAAMADLKAILDSREPLYARADAMLHTEGQTASESIAELAKLVPRPNNEGS